MKILISGGSGFLGRALTKSLLRDGHQVYALTRGKKINNGAQTVQWDGKTTNGWGHLVNDMDVVIHLTGRALSTFPWTASNKRSFGESRINPGRALVSAILEADRRPSIFIQQSGINYYGLRGSLADEATPPADDFLAQLAVQWEAATQPIEDAGVRRIIARTAPVLDQREGLIPLLTLPIRLFLGGPIAGGEFCMPWIHIHDWVEGIRFLIEREDAQGAYNFVAPTPTSSAEFNRSLAKILRRPYWFPVPVFLLKTFLGEMSVLIVEGRFTMPRRLLESGFEFKFKSVEDAFVDLYQ